MLFHSSTLAMIYPPYSPGTDKGTTHSYIDIYETVLGRFRFDAKRILEIGINSGLSLLMWRDYFPNAEIIGVDIEPAPDWLIQHSRLKCICGDSCDPTTFADIADIDIVIDDGDHTPQAQINTFRIVWPKVRPNGLYIIEDIQDFDDDAPVFLVLDKSARIYDMRRTKGRYDDVLITYVK